jgi:membrane protease YdiL (CAAX protease family)
MQASLNYSGAKKAFQLLVIFVVLFSLYHAAEYMIMFRNNALLFFLFQALFFVSAYFLGKWYNGTGLSSWGLPFPKRVYRPFFFGMILGIILYGIPFALSLYLGVEKLVSIPPTSEIILSSLPFAVGVLLTSFSEDILTRGLIYSEAGKKIRPVFIILFSAALYLFNHIYRLTDGPETWTYLFLLGIIFMIPLIQTGNLWLTGAMHWAGNLFFFVTHSAIDLQETGHGINYNTLFSIWLVLYIPVVYFISRKISEKENTTQSSSIQ